MSQTSLEQIFQHFAEQSVEDKAAYLFKINELDELVLVNPDGKSTIEKKKPPQLQMQLNATNTTASEATTSREQTLVEHN